jgi:hypothetical protein
MSVPQEAVAVAVVVGSPGVLPFHHWGLLHPLHVSHVLLPAEVAMADAVGTDMVAMVEVDACLEKALQGDWAPVHVEDNPDTYLQMVV